MRKNGSVLWLKIFVKNKLLAAKLQPLANDKNGAQFMNKYIG